MKSYSECTRANKYGKKFTDTRLREMMVDGPLRMRNALVCAWLEGRVYELRMIKRSKP